MNEAVENAQNVYVAPSNAYNSNIVLLTDPSNELYNLELTFRGLMEDKQGNLMEYGRRLMNDEGICSVIGMTRSVVNRINIMGNLSEKDMRAMLDFFADTLVKDLMMNRVRYEMDKMSQRTVFFDAISLVYFTMRRPLDQGERIFHSKTTQEIKSTVQSNTQNKSLWSKINPWANKE